MYTNQPLFPTLKTKGYLFLSFIREKLWSIFSYFCSINCESCRYMNKNPVWVFSYIYIYICIVTNFWDERCLESVTRTTWELNSRVVTKILLKLMLLFLFCDWLQSSESCIVHPPTCTELGCMLLSPAIYQANISMNDEMHNGLGETRLIHLLILK